MGKKAVHFDDFFKALSLIFFLFLFLIILKCIKKNEIMPFI